MHEHFDAKAFDDPDFKEDAVREVVIAPMLSRLGYHPVGAQTVVHSKALVQPFIYVGTKKHPVTIIPDYTLRFDDRTVLVLDAKSPRESVLSPANVQQAYSYAIHPEVRSKHFALCNGRQLVLFSVDSQKPLFELQFAEFESRWSDIERHFSPRFLLDPELRKLKPDFGFKVSRLGVSKHSKVVLLETRLGMFSKLSDDLYTVSVNIEFGGEDHCVSFDFTREQLPQMIAGLPDALAGRFLDALSRAPFQAGADLLVDVDVRTHLGDPVEVEHETFVPLVIDEVLGSRFRPVPPPSGGADIPAHIFRLSKAFKVLRPDTG